MDKNNTNARLVKSDGSQVNVIDNFLKDKHPILESEKIFVCKEAMWARVTLVGYFLTPRG